MKLVVVILCWLFLPLAVYSQFPASCNTPENLESKTCCPNDCGAGSDRGSCVNVTQEVVNQWGKANSTIVELLQNTPNEPEKGTADARYLWPTVIFESVCQCNENYGGYNCMECDFGWSGTDCQTRKVPVVRRHFNSLNQEEKDEFINATKQLKNELGVWSVIVEEPKNYTFGTATLQNVSTYNFLIYLHDYSARDAAACRTANRNNTVNFAHLGPVFPVWHRRYMLTVEKEFQRIMNNEQFGFPYWQWEENDRSPFNLSYYGIPSNSLSLRFENVSGILFDSDNWNTVCDLIFWNRSLTCSSYWRPCNPERDLTEKRPLQRGGGTTYLPNRVEVMIAIAAPSYDAANPSGDFGIDGPRTSFRSRLEGWNNICSAANCVGTRGTPNSPTFSCRMHNNVHDWVGGQMDVVPAAVNDPIFNMHHCNVDRVLESWMNRFTGSNSTDSQLLPSYVPVSGAHPGHNRDDYIVPFFPLIKVSRQYSSAEEWGYTYDNLIIANIKDNSIVNCEILPPDSCPICRANGSCIDCTNQTCPAPMAESDPNQPESFSAATDSTFLGLGLGLGIPLLLAILIIIALIVYVCSKKGSKSKSTSNVQTMEMTVKS